MNIEEYYKTSTEGYLEFLDLLVKTAREDKETTVAELTYLIAHREFAKQLLETLVEEMEK